MVLSLYYPFLSIDNIYMSVKFRNSDGTTQLGYIDLVNINMTVMNQQNGNLILGTNNAEDMRILTNGNVGIGTQTPEFTLDVNGNARIGTTSTNTFTLFNNPFAYVPWTELINHTGTWSTTNPFTNWVDAGGTTRPAPASIAISGLNGSITRYYYSVVGKTMFLNWFHYASTSTVAPSTVGDGQYYYRIPPGFTPATWLRQTLTANPTNAYLGTRVGSGILHAYGLAREDCNVYYINTTVAGGGGGVARNYICLLREPGAGTFQNSGSFEYNLAGRSIQYTFDAAIPLA